MLKVTDLCNITHLHKNILSYTFSSILGSYISIMLTTGIVYSLRNQLTLLYWCVSEIGF